MPLSRQVCDLGFVNLWIVNCRLIRLPVHVQLHQLLIWMSMGPFGQSDSSGVCIMGFVGSCHSQIVSLKFGSRFQVIPWMNVVHMASAWANTSLNCWVILVPHEHFGNLVYLVHMDDLSEHTSESGIDGFGLSELLVLVASTVIHNCYGQFL